ncbi:unnamed protein product [Caenorhabditis nigoni]
MTAKFLILIFCLSSVVIANELSEEFLIEAVGESNSITEYQEYDEVALLSIDPSEYSMVQLNDVLKMPIVDGSSDEFSGESSGDSDEPTTRSPENAISAGTPETPDNSSQLLDFLKMAAGSLILLFIGSVLIVTIFGIGLWMRKMIRWARRKIQGLLRNPQEAEMEMISLDKFFPDFFVNVV